MVGLVFAAVVFAKLYFTSDRLKALIIPRIEQSTHREVAVRDISFTILPSLGVSIEGLNISNQKNRGFEREEFLSLDHLTLDVKILPLLSSRVDIKQIVLDRPVIYLEVTKDGVKNFSGNEPETGGPTGTSQERGQAGAFLLSDLEIKDGELTYTDRKFDSRIAMNGLNASLRAASKPGENAFRLDETASIDKFSYGTLSSWYITDQPVTAQGSLDYQFDSDVLRFGNIAIKVKEVPLT